MSERKILLPWLLASATAVTSPAMAQQAAPVATVAPAPVPDAPSTAPAETPGEPMNVSAPPPSSSPNVARAPDASVTVGLRDAFTRLSFSFAGATTVNAALTGVRLDLRFSRAADIDLAEVRSSLPRYVRSLTRVSRAGQPLRLALTLDPGVRQRSFTDGQRVIVDLLTPDATTQPTTQSGDMRLPEAGALPAGPPPPSGTAPVRVTEGADATTISVRWATPARAAAFRRGEAIWILFEANGRLDLRGIVRAAPRHQDIELVSAPGVVGLRMPAPPEISVSAHAEGASWTFTLATRARGENPPAPVDVDAAQGGRLIADFDRAGAVHAITDPEIGDRLLVAMLPGPAIGVETRRSTIQAAILPSAQGAVIEPRADGVGAMFDDGKLIVSRAAGLVTAAAAQSQTPTSNVAALEAGLAAHGDSTVDQLSLRDVRRRLDDLQRRAAAEGTEVGAPATARLALARFLIVNEFPAEALGALRLAQVNQPEIELDPDFRLMRAAANVMLHRARDATADLASSALANDASAALWRGYAAAEAENWSQARSELQRGQGALEQFSPNWRARFALALGQSALAMNDVDAAENAARDAIGQATTQTVRLHARLVEARVAAARGREHEATALLDELGRSSDEEVAVRAQFEAVKLRRAANDITPADAADKLEALRYRWRGDSLELQVVGALGVIYAEMGRWRDALATMRVAAERFPTDPAARQLQADMQAIFVRLFLDGEADHLEPIQALGLFYEFSDLTPIGPDGDRIVRLLSGRLVAVDLLEQAENLLQHQVDERLEGVGKAQVAGELAAIYLMDHKPEQALTAVNSSRQPGIPAALVAQRRIIEARAHLDLGRLDHAVELVERDQSVDAQRVRAEAAWRSRDWERAAAEMRTLLRLRGRATPLDADGRQVVLRAAIALTLAQKDSDVRALYRDYAGDMANTPDSDAFEIVASGAPQQGAAIRDVARAVARTDLLDRFLQNIRAQMTAGAPVAPNTAQAAAPAPQAQAAPTPPAA